MDINYLKEDVHNIVIKFVGNVKRMKYQRDLLALYVP